MYDDAGALPTDLKAFVDRVRSVTDKDLAVGFGISTPEQVGGSIKATRFSWLSSQKRTRLHTGLRGGCGGRWGRGWFSNHQYRRQRSSRRIDGGSSGEAQGMPTSICVSSRSLLLLTEIFFSPFLRGAGLHQCIESRCRQEAKRREGGCINVLKALLQMVTEFYLVFSCRELCRTVDLLMGRSRERPMCLIGTSGSSGAVTSLRPW